MNRAIFLDRDGVLCEAIVVNYKPFSARNLNDLTIQSMTIRGCHNLKSLGFKLLCFSNQPDIDRGLVEKSIITQQNDMITHFCELDDILVCPSADDSDIYRKPNPGMLYELAIKHKIDFQKSYLIGDRWSDIEAGHRVNMTSENMYYINRGYDEPWPSCDCQHIHFFEDAVKDIMKKEQK